MKKSVIVHSWEYMAKAPGALIHETNGRNVKETIRQVTQRLTVATDMARPRTRVGKSSDIKTHAHTPSPTA